METYLDDKDNPRPPYSLRHYYAIQRLLDGVQVYDLAKNMGTSVKQIEHHYGHVLSTQKTNELIQGAGISYYFIGIKGLHLSIKIIIKNSSP